MRRGEGCTGGVRGRMCWWGEGRDVQVRGGEGCAGEGRGGMYW